MFGRKNTEAHELRNKLADIRGQLAAMFDRPILSDIRREGSANILTFVRNGEEFQITTYATYDDLENWRKLAGLDK